MSHPWAEGSTIRDIKGKTLSYSDGRYYFGSDPDFVLEFDGKQAADYVVTYKSITGRWPSFTRLLKFGYIKRNRYFR
jgi:hypothetical protein